MRQVKIFGADSAQLKTGAQAMSETLLRRLPLPQVLTSSAENKQLAWHVVGQSPPAIIKELSIGPPLDSFFLSMEHGRREGRNKFLMVFSGLGFDLEGWWLEDYKNNPAFASALDWICHHVKLIHGVDMRKTLMLDAGRFHATPELENQHSASFCVQIALVETWKACHVIPDMVIGHSIGEYAAAVATGAISWREGLALVVAQDALVAKGAPTGGMLAVFQSQEEVESILEKAAMTAKVAYRDAPNVTVLSGSVKEMQQIQHVFDQSAVGFQRLEAKHAFHSKLMGPFLAELGSSVRSILGVSNDPDTDSDAFGSFQQRDGTQPIMLSTVSTEPVSREELRQPEYWTKQFETTVDFAGAMRNVDKSFGTVVEVGPSSKLVELVEVGMAGDRAPLVATSSFSNSQPGRATAFCRALSRVLMSPWALSAVPTLEGFARESENALQGTSTEDWANAKEKQTIIRSGHVADTSKLFEIETASWPVQLRASREQIQRRMQRNPEGQFVACVADKVCGVLYTQRLAAVEKVDADYVKVEEEFVLDGPTLQLLSISVDPQFGSVGLGKQLIQRCLMQATSTPSVERIVAVTRCRSFQGADWDALTTYIHSCWPDGAPIDPLLAFHIENGAAVRRLVPNYRPKDEVNLGAGVLVEYDLPTIRDRLAATKGKTNTLKNHFSPAAVASIVQDELCSLTGASLAEMQTLLSFGWMEIGLDSVSLMQLKARLQKSFSVPLDDSFFFEHHSPKKAVEALVAAATADPADPRRERLIDAQQPVGTSASSDSDPVAIIGMGCKLPGADGPDEFWELLVQGKTVIGPPPRERLRVSPNLDGAGGWLPDIATWNAAFFGVSEAAANLMDPQHRFLLEVSWLALEHAGLNPDSVAGTQTGIYFGIFGEEYYRQVCLATPEMITSPYFGTGTSASGAAGVVAHTLDTRGPAMSINTACSSSLVAVSQAHKALLAGECDMAIAGGVNVVLSQDTVTHFRAVGIVSPDGACKPLDAAASGTVIGEGAGVVVCKLLSKAIADNDNVLAVIPSSTVNQDGRSTVITAPNPEAQRNLLKETMRKAGLRSDDIDFVELHATATALGDPIEVNQVAAVLGDRNSTCPVLLGSAKANLGHLFAAAGIASLIKVVLCLQREMVTPQPSFETLNPKIRPGMTVPTVLTPWPDRTGLAGHSRAAIVSSFGFTGTNAQLAVVSPPRRRTAANSRTTAHTQHILTISAQTRECFLELVNKHTAAVGRLMELRVGDYCFTSNVGRKHFPIRRAFVAASAAELVAKLKRSVAPPAPSETSALVFAFPPPSEILHERIDTVLAETHRLREVYQELCREIDSLVRIQLEPTHKQALQGFAYSLAVYTWLKSVGCAPTQVTGRGSGMLVAAYLALELPLATVVQLLIAPSSTPFTAVAGSEALLPRDAPFPGLVTWSDGVSAQISLQDLSGMMGVEGFSTSVPFKTELSTKVVVEVGHVERGLRLSSSNAESLGLFSAVAELYQIGFNVHWEELHLDSHHKKIDIPTYPLRVCNDSFWMTGTSHAPQWVLTEQTHCTSRWTMELDAAMVTYLSDHRVRDVPVVPATCYMEMLAPLVEEVHGDVPYELRDVRFESMLSLDSSQQYALRVAMQHSNTLEDGDSACALLVESRCGLEEMWKKHAQMKLLVRSQHATETEEVDVEEIMKQCDETFCSREELYNTFGNEYTGDFKSLSRFWTGNGIWLGKIILPSEHSKQGPTGSSMDFLRRCAELDCAIQAGMFCLEEAERLTGVVVASVGAFYRERSGRFAVQPMWSLVRRDVESGLKVKLISDGKTVASFDEVRLHPVKQSTRLSVFVDEWDMLLF